jgi:preprotein translocase subunit SecD
MAEQLNTNEKATGQSNSSLKIILGVAAVFIGLCGLVALGIGYILVRPSFAPKTQVILEPDHSQVSTVDAADLKSAAEILTARCQSLGYSGVSFTANENNQIIGRVPSSLDAETALKPVLAIGLLEFVDFGKTPLETGTKIQTDFDYPYFPQAEGAVLHTIMTNDVFEEVTVTTDYVGKPAVSFTFNAKGTKIFADFTTNNVGRYLGIVLDKVVMSSPVINSPITAGQGVIQGSFTAEEANALAAYLKTKGPLPLPLIIKQVIKNGG